MKRTMIQRMGKSTAALLLAAAVSVGFLQGAMTPVSYTHLTLPTNSRV